jgi:hypothetical protein
MKIKMIKQRGKRKRNRRKIEDYVERRGMFSMRHTRRWFQFPRESVDTFLYWLLWRLLTF